MSHLFDVKNKVALVTGGSRGIGYVIAQGLLQQGAKVYIVSRKLAQCQAAAEQLQAYGDVYALSADLSQFDQIEALVHELQQRETRLDILVNNAGATWGAALGEYPEQGWDKVMDTNVKSVFFLTQALLPLLKQAATAQQPSKVINIGSMDGLSVPRFNSYAYSSSKAAVHHLTRHLAGHLAAEHININAIAPGPFATDMMKFAIEHQRAQIEQRIPLHRIGEADDLIGTTLFLASKASNYITGAVIPLDGGYSDTH
jgi:NAD(P)-dependent dehydrogenase (short-subunit alcohol dehydrogenase family)